MPGREFLTNCKDDPGRSLAARNTRNLSESRASPCVDSLQATRRNPARPPAAEQSDCGLRRSVRQPISPKQKAEPGTSYRRDRTLRSPVMRVS